MPTNGVNSFTTTMASSDTNERHAILIKTPPPSLDDDPYTQVFSQATPPFNTHYVSPLTTTLTHSDSLRHIIQSGSQLWSGVIVTSQRSVDSWLESASTLQLDDDATTSWNKVPWFVVGPATHSKLLDLSATLSNHLRPNDSCIFGQQTGSASRLLPLIISTLPPTPTKPLLYLCGDKRTPELRDGLQTSTPPIPFTLLETYKTESCPHCLPNLTTLLQRLVGSDCCLILFSPSGSTSILPLLTSNLNLTKPDQVLIGVIGQTTQSWYETQLNQPPNIVSKKPTPHSLLESIQHFYDNLKE